MACYHPLRAFDTGLLTDSGKPKYKICGPNVDRIHAPYSYMRNGLQKSSKQIWQDQWIKEWTPIPCGQCIGCRMDYSRMWADRCMLEAQQYEHNAFITLTYDPEHLPPFKDVLDVESGEVSKWPSLVPDDLSDFIRALRDYYRYHFNWCYKEHEVQESDVYDYKKFVNVKDDKGKLKKDSDGKPIKVLKYFKIDNEGIRFYACGEYGSLSGRPHFHVLVFNLPPLPDMKHWFTTDAHEKIYHSDILQNDIWKKGICSIGELTWNSAAYVARYVVKKQKGTTKGLVDLCGNLVSGIEPEFTRMSRMPGIARKYYDEHKHQFYETDEIVMSIRGKVRTIKPPRYFDKMYDLECQEFDENNIQDFDPFKMREIKKARAENAKKSIQDQLSRTTLNEEEYLSVKERNKSAQVERLKRGLME